MPCPVRRAGWPSPSRNRGGPRCCGTSPAGRAIRESRQERTRRIAASGSCRPEGTQAGHGGGIVMPEGPSDRVIVFDTTLRDGEQAPGFSMTVVEKLEMARQLTRLGVDVIEAGFRMSSDEYVAAVREVTATVGS